VWWTPLLVGSLLASSLFACAGPERAPDTDVGAFEFQGQQSYVRTTRELLGADLELQTVGPQLVRCYEAEAVAGPDDISHVQVELAVVGGALQARVAQSRTNLSESFASCIDRVIMSWDVEVQDVEPGEIIPLEFGPVESSP
jgi:hypothetical protein